MDAPTHTTSSQITPHAHCRVDGQYLHVRGPLILPTNRCVKCGSTETGGAIRTEVVSYVNPLVWLTLLISGLVTIIAYYSTRKKLEVQYYLCPECADSRKIAEVSTNLVMLTSIIGMALTIMGGPFEIFALAMVFGLIGRIFWARKPLRAVRHDHGQFALEGADQDFLDSLERPRLPDYRDY